MDGQDNTISFNLSTGVAVNSIIALPILMQCGSNIDFGTSKFFAPKINTQFYLLWSNKTIFTSYHEFKVSCFIRQPHSNLNGACVMLSNIASDSLSETRSTIYSGSQPEFIDSNIGLCFKRNVALDHLLRLSHPTMMVQYTRASAFKLC